MGRKIMRWAMNEIRGTEWESVIFPERIPDNLRRKTKKLYKELDDAYDKIFEQGGNRERFSDSF